jgi:hypothetical protein
VLTAVSEFPHGTDFPGPLASLTGLAMLALQYFRTRALARRNSALKLRLTALPQDGETSAISLELTRAIALLRNGLASQGTP